MNNKDFITSQLILILSTIGIGFVMFTLAFASIAIIQTPINWVYYKKFGEKLKTKKFILRIHLINLLLFITIMTFTSIFGQETFKFIYDWN